MLRVHCTVAGAVLRETDSAESREGAEGCAALMQGQLRECCSGRGSEGASCCGKGGGGAPHCGRGSDGALRCGGVRVPHS